VWKKRSFITTRCQQACSSSYNNPRLVTTIAIVWTMRFLCSFLFLICFLSLSVFLPSPLRVSASSAHVQVSVEVDEAEAENLPHSSPAALNSAEFDDALSEFDESESAELDSANGDGVNVNSIDEGIPVTRCSSGAPAGSAKNAKTGHCVFTDVCERVGGVSVPDSKNECSWMDREVCCQSAKVDPFTGPVEPAQQAIENLLQVINQSPQIWGQLKKIALFDYTKHKSDRRFFYYDFVAPQAPTPPPAPAPAATSSRRKRKSKRDEENNAVVPAPAPLRATAENLVLTGVYRVSHGHKAERRDEKNRPVKPGYSLEFNGEESKGWTPSGFFSVQEPVASFATDTARLVPLSSWWAYAGRRTEPRIFAWSGVARGVPTVNSFGVMPNVAAKVTEEMRFQGLVYSYGYQVRTDLDDRLAQPLTNLKAPKLDNQPRK
jgi:hypothetical protein